MINDITEKVLNDIVTICNQICIGFQVDSEHISISQFSDGFVSPIYKVTFKNIPKDSVLQQPPESVVVKFFGDDIPYNKIHSKVNSLIIAENNLSPKVLLITDNAIVLEFIEGCALTRENDKNESIFQLLAAKLAKFHSLEVPIPRNKSQDQVKYVCEQWVTQETLQTLYTEQLKELLVQKQYTTLLNNRLDLDVQLVKECMLTQQCAPIVFSHCDFNHGNIMVINKSSTPKIIFIDFDFSCYHYRGVDLGRYLADCEQTNWYEDELTVSDQRKLQFISYYVDENCRVYGEEYRLNPNNSHSQILKEAKIGMLFAYMIDILFCVWTAVTKEDKKEEFLNYAEKRYKTFLRAKKQFQEENIIPI